MKYADGTRPQLGGLVRFLSGDPGQIVGDTAVAKCLAPLIAPDWAFLETGLLIKTEFGVLINYESLADEDLQFLSVSSMRSNR